MTAAARSLLCSWALALALSAILVAAGQRWPQPLAPLPAAVWALLLLPGLAMALLLRARWSLQTPGTTGEHPNGARRGDAGQPPTPEG